ncbi:MAG: peptidoglycan DD-metalloendopeptidase family protein [Oscillospiraceae bacterium]|nr:peptidoglycan DD-metalloendopeptidase family protein [Oscillospiraceae bacterium]
MRQIAIPRGDALGDAARIHKKTQSVRRLEKSRRNIERMAIKGQVASGAILHNVRPKLSLFGRLRAFVLSAKHRGYIFGVSFRENAYRALCATGRTLQSPFVGTWRRIRARDHKVYRHARLNAIIVTLLVAGVITAIGFFDFGIAVDFNGEQIGFVANQQVFDNAVSNVNQQVSRMLGEPFRMELDVAYHYSLVDSRQMLEQRDIERILFSSVEGLDTGYILTIDGTQVGVSDSREKLDTLIEEYKESHVEYGVAVEIASDIEISRNWVSVDTFMGKDELYEVLHRPLRGTVESTVNEGDTIASFAAAYGMTPDILKSLNPETLNGEDVVPAGTRLIVNPALPLVSMATTTTVEVEESIPFERETVNNANMFQGERRVSQQGSYGTRMATFDVRVVDGFEQSRTLVSETITREPVTEITQVGTRARPATVARGNFVRPLRGNFRVTSHFGWRRSGFHHGVDWGAPFGTPIHAADGGRVAFAGRRGNLGLVVEIDHGSGVRTVYAHASSIQVSVGQQVFQGQQIARVGSTGRSTGNHLHFEIRFNGNPVNPLHHLRG